MYRNFKIVKVDSDYCDFLREYDNRVVYNAGKKELRPFIGVLFIINKKNILLHYLALKQSINY